MSDEELNQHLQDAQQELFNLRFQKATHELTNTSRIGQVKRDIARIKTILHERRLGIRAQQGQG
ncbi:MAG TPA: 50S ribosomal protein L29 [Chloroflexota bacterium]|nr:50S ribosomal protein L29 [Chloroflexota bacterium]